MRDIKTPLCSLAMVRKFLLCLVLASGCYKIPELQPDEKGENLVHTMESGVKVAITKDKGIVVTATQSQTERKASFN